MRPLVAVPAKTPEPVLVQCPLERSWGEGHYILSLHVGAEFVWVRNLEVVSPKTNILDGGVQNNRVELVRERIHH